MSVVIIEPTELGFRRPLTVEVSETLRIKNPNAIPVAFKVKTTAPKQYCVRPNSGRIEPDREVEVSVLLQAMKQDPPENYKCRDKFLVQAVPITNDKVFAGVQEIWDNVNKADIEETKIRVAFLNEDDSDRVPAVTPIRGVAPNGTDVTPNVPPPSFVSPHEQPRVSSGFAAPDAALHIKGGGTPALASPEQTKTSTSRSTPTASTPAPDKDATITALKAKLAENEALIASLRLIATQRSKDSGLKQRSGAGVSTGTSEKAPAKADKPAETGAAPQLDQVTRRGTEGVPVQVTALLCLLSFVLAYLFF